ncbi:DNA mismatch endonuclease Vsr [Methylobacterium sp. W2]|uniref:very short patch repair endonuclease n=1 Tax=Methylobacterium sp. W2 TaxID=2598107 RepID=UPI001D0C54E4|nr:DNA mismatch endonuclease Vsr [Methylobacterium sp. W2]MCC0808798.1 DNA mismatch endonuclease Vsr [Methylobacterium sp. W2]
MVNTLTPGQRSERMGRVHNKNTKPEMRVRRLVHSMGYQYRLHRKDPPGKPDMVFPSLKAVILVHECFWHRHPDPSCPLTRTPKSRLEFWGPKFKANHARDLRNEAELTRLGWRVLTVWECGLRDVEGLQGIVRAFLGAKG